VSWERGLLDGSRPSKQDVVALVLPIYRPITKTFYLRKGVVDSDGSSITGFMAVKNVLSQGYPFVEAIASGLRICDEFLISDGYSCDGTYEILTEIANANRKIKLYRDLWPKARDFSTVLREITNTVKRRAHGRYLLNLQANEVIHENSMEFIKALPEIMPDYLTFSFPFVQLLSKYVWREEFRIRFAQNLDCIEALGDAWTLGLSRSAVFKLLVLNLDKILGLVGGGVRAYYANTGYSEHSRIVYLPEPVFRYYSLFPLNFVEKMRNHIELFTEYEWKPVEQFLAKYETTDSANVDPDTFWKEAMRALVEFASQSAIFPKRSRPVPIIEKDKHPHSVRHFIENPSVHAYYVRTALLDAIKGL
jgi:hypothetical protein